jgi:hypothetical protein
MTQKGDSHRLKTRYLRGVRRRLAAVVLAVLALPALALASHKDPKEQFNAADQRKAASIVLKRGDFVAGWKKTPSSPDDDGHLGCPGYDPNGADLILTGEAEADFEASGGFPSVFSFSNVFKTRAHASASWTRAVKPALAACLAKVFKEGLEAEGHKATITRSGKIAFPKLAPRTAAYRVVMNVTVTENGTSTTVPFTMFVVALGHGRGDVGLMTMGFGNSVPLNEVRTLSSVLAKRLAAAKL